MRVEKLRVASCELRVAVASCDLGVASWFFFMPSPYFVDFGYFLDLVGFPLLWSFRAARRSSQGV